MTRLVAAVVVACAFGVSVGVGCASKDDDHSNAAAGASAQGGSSGAGASGGDAGTAGSAPGVGGSTGGSSSGAGGGAGRSQGGAGSGGASAGAGQGGMSAAGGNGTAGLNDRCAYTDNSSSYSAIADDICISGYCLWDARAIGDTYCTIPCAGPDATCPMSYVCVEDQETAGKYWCGRPARVVPPDVGTVACSSSDFDCINNRADPNAFCIAFNNSACTDQLCLQDPIDQSNYCTTTCFDPKAPCPDGYDCIHDPSSSIGDHYCAKHHEPIEHVGIDCIAGNRGCGLPCPTYEEAAFQCSPDGTNPCMAASPTDYCTARCEDVPCPTGYDCTNLTTTPGSPQSGKYCVKTPS